MADSDGDLITSAGYQRESMTTIYSVPKPGIGLPAKPAEPQQVLWIGQITGLKRIRVHLAASVVSSQTPGLDAHVSITVSDAMRPITLIRTLDLYDGKEITFTVPAQSLHITALNTVGNDIDVLWWVSEAEEVPSEWRVVHQTTAALSKNDVVLPPFAVSMEVTVQDLALPAPTLGIHATATPLVAYTQTLATPTSGPIPIMPDTTYELIPGAVGSAYAIVFTCRG